MTARTLYVMRFRIVTATRALILLCTMCLLCTQTTQGQNGPSPSTLKPAASTPSPVKTPAPSEVPETPAPTVADTPAPTMLPTQSPTVSPTNSPTAEPTLAPTMAPTTPGPTLSPTLSPTPGPTMMPSLHPTPFPGTFAPTPPPTFSYDSYCERPYDFMNESDAPCSELVTEQDKDNGIGAFYDEAECIWQERGRSVVGCNLEGVVMCRLCVFNRGLYSRNILGGEEAPFVDCPCCVPELYDLGGDIDCDFPATPAPEPVSTVPAPPPQQVTAPVAAPVAPPVAAPVASPVAAPVAAAPANGNAGGDVAPVTEDGGDGERGVGDANVTPAPVAPTGTVSPTVPPIPTAPCEFGAGGTQGANVTLCVDLASILDLENGIGIYYEEGCGGIGCSIFGELDCRQCIFDRTAYAAAGLEGADTLEDCPCCVPISYRLRPEDSSCLWPPTPAPSSAPTTLAELLANGVYNPGKGGIGALAISAMGAVASLLAAGGVAAFVANAKL